MLFQSPFIVRSPYRVLRTRIFSLQAGQPNALSNSLFAKSLSHSLKGERKRETVHIWIFFCHCGPTYALSNPTLHQTFFKTASIWFFSLVRTNVGCTRICWHFGKQVSTVSNSKVPSVTLESTNPSTIRSTLNMCWQAFSPGNFTPSVAFKMILGWDSYRQPCRGVDTVGKAPSFGATPKCPRFSSRVIGGVLLVLSLQICSYA